MNRGFRRFVTISLCSVLCVLAGCTKGGGSEGDGGGSSDDGGTTDRGAGRTNCGVVVDGSLQNPANFGDGTFVRVTDVLSNNLLLVAENGDQSKSFLIKLQGVASSSDSNTSRNATSHIRSLTAGGAYFFKATEDCQITLNGRPATVGSLVTPDGLSIAEDLIAKVFSDADPNDACRGDLIGSCLKALEEENDVPSFADVGCGFLWKPVSDSDGNAVVLVDSCDVRVFVNGEEFRQAGPGNGRCTTARGSKPGCAYGSATIEVVDLFTGLPYEFPTGQTKLTTPGCGRREFPCRQ